MMKEERKRLGTRKGSTHQHVSWHQFHEYGNAYCHNGDLGGTDMPVRSYLMYDTCVQASSFKIPDCLKENNLLLVDLQVFGLGWRPRYFCADTQE